MIMKIESYDELEYNMAPGMELSGYQLCGSFTTCSTLIKGDWEVAFPIVNRGMEKKVNQ